MKPSPLQLERYFFTKIQLEAHATKDAKVAHQIECNVELGQAVEEPRRYQVELNVRLKSPPDQQAAYTGEFQAVGLFRVVDSCPQEKCDDLVEANGAALLFGAIREMVSNLTSRGPWPAVMLRTVTFAQGKGQTIRPNKTDVGRPALDPPPLAKRK